MNELKDFLKSRTIVNLLIVLLNIGVFAILEWRGSTENTSYMMKSGAAYAPLIVGSGEYYRLFTSMFMHFGIEHLFNNMLVLLFLGDTLERAVGKVRYLLIYLIGGLGGNILSLYMELRTGDFSVSAGASGAVFAVIGALVYVVARNKGRLEDLSGRGLVFMVVLTLFQGFTSSGVDNAAHVGGLVCGILLAILLYHRKKGHKKRV